MAINGNTLDNVLAVSNAMVTEGTFQDRIEDMVRQIDITQQHMAADRTIQIAGDITAPAITYQLNDTADYDITLTVTYDDGTISTNALIDGSVTNPKLAANAVTNDKVVNGTLTADKINATEKRRFRILDTGGTALFEMYGLID